MNRVLRDPSSYSDPEGLARLAGEVDRLLDGAAVVVALSEREARVVRSSLNTAQLLRSALKDVLPQADEPAPVETAAMKIETAMISEGIAR